MNEQPKDRPDGDGVLKAARSRIAAMKIAPCSGLTSSRAAAAEIERALDFLSAAPTCDGAEGAGPITTEQLDRLQFGHDLHARPPAPPKPAPDAMREVARNLVQNASSIIHTDAVGHRFQKVFECDLKALAAAISAPVLPADGALDTALLDWLEEGAVDAEGRENPVDTIYLDDGKIIDVGGSENKGRGLRAAIATAMQKAGAVIPPSPAVAAEPVARWYVGAQNDGLFIINAEPRPSNDDVWHDRPNGPTVVLNVTELPLAKAQKIVDVMNGLASPTVRGDRGVPTHLAKAINDLSDYADDLDGTERPAMGEYDVTKDMRLVSQALIDALTLPVQPGAGEREALHRSFADAVCTIEGIANAIKKNPEIDCGEIRHTLLVNVPIYRKAAEANNIQIRTIKSDGEPYDFGTARDGHAALAENLSRQAPHSSSETAK